MRLLLALCLLIFVSCTLSMQDRLNRKAQLIADAVSVYCRENSPELRAVFRKELQKRVAPNAIQVHCAKPVMPEEQQ